MRVDGIRSWHEPEDSTSFVEGRGGAAIDPSGGLGGPAVFHLRRAREATARVVAGGRGRLAALCHVCGFCRRARRPGRVCGASAQAARLADFARRDARGFGAVLHHRAEPPSGRRGLGDLLRLPGVHHRPFHPLPGRGRGRAPLGRGAGRVDWSAGRDPSRQRRAAIGRDLPGAVGRMLGRHHHRHAPDGHARPHGDDAVLVSPGRPAAADGCAAVRVRAADVRSGRHGGRDRVGSLDGAVLC